MPTALPPQPNTESRRLEETLALMNLTRQLPQRGGRFTAAIFRTGGIGDWGDAAPYSRSLALVCRLCRDGETLDAFRTLVQHVEAHAGRLLHHPCPDGQVNYIMPLFRMAGDRDAWRRPPSEWRPRKETAERQFRHLVSFLLSPDDGEEFLRKAFRASPADRVKSWFGHLQRDAHRASETPKPVYITKRMAYHFLQAPRNYDFIRAFRWSQVSGFGGGALLARAVDFTRLAWQIWDPTEEEWWAGALQWLAGRPDLDAAHVTPIVDYIYARRYGVKDLEVPPDPAFSMKGRSLAPLLRSIEEWHEELATRRTITHTEFRSSGVPPGRWEFPTEAEPLVWTIEEIRDSRSLLEEGRKMRHCVSTYLEAVENGKCSIWSMKFARGNLVRRATTIQLQSAGRRIVQCRGHCNRQPKPEEKKILKLWAAENGLKLQL